MFVHRHLYSYHGQLKDSNPARRNKWVGRAVWFQNAACQLVVDAAECLDRLIQRQVNEEACITAKRETRYTNVVGEQVSATATVFVPDDTLTRVDIQDMNAMSEDDAWRAEVIATTLARMTTAKREETMQWLRGEAGQFSGQPNPVIGMLK